MHAATRVSAKEALEATSDPKVIKAYEPATRRLLGEVKVDGPDEVRRKVGRARKAQQLFRSTSFADRAKLLLKMRAVFLADADDIVEECAANGSGSLGAFVCDSPAEAYFSACVEDSPGRAACTCRDEWDCPPYQVCEAGQCRGTGEQPTCRLDPAPFTA